MLRKAVSQAVLKTRINKNPPPSGFFIAKIMIVLAVSDVKKASEDA